MNTKNKMSAQFRRSSLRRTGNSSIINIFSPPSSATSHELDISSSVETKGIIIHGADPNTKIVEEIVNNIFDEKNGFYDVSSSHCSSVMNRSSEYSFDKRLKYWKNAIHERRKIAQQINEKTGKHPSAVLFNRLTTVDDRDKQTVKRLIDYADRMNPITLMNKKSIRLQEYVNQDCEHINFLDETLPKAERDHAKIVEISGLSSIAKKEQLGSQREQGMENKHQWLKSKTLERRIEEKREDIERVIEYYPDIEHLQVVGESLQRACVLKHDSNINLLQEEKIKHISSDTSACEDEDCRTGKDERQKDIEPPEYGIRINDQVFIMVNQRSSKNVVVEIPFVCEPFEKVVKPVLRLENIGKKILNCEWVQRSYFEKTAQLLKGNDQEFLFNRNAFRLTAGEMRDILVQFRPRKVDICKERWLLKIDPQFFCRKMDAVVVKLSGRCIPPPEYVEKLDEIQRIVIGKSNMKMMRTLTGRLGSITPLVKPYEAICPYKRILSERELFESYNVGYKCDRFHDLELLKDIYKRVKKPREHAWDLKLDSLKSKILRVESAERRALLFGEMVGILEEMKGKPKDLELKVVDNPERDRTRMVYVRGIVSTGIDEWEDIANNVEEAFLKPALQQFQDKLMSEEVGEGEENYTNELDPDAIKEHLVKTIRRRKAFRDTIYVQTYTHMCDVIENIVSVIESTEIV